MKKITFVALLFISAFLKIQGQGYNNLKYIILPTETQTTDTGGICSSVEQQDFIDNLTTVSDVSALEEATINIEKEVTSSDNSDKYIFIRVTTKSSSGKFTPGPNAETAEEDHYINRISSSNDSNGTIENLSLHAISNSDITEGMCAAAELNAKLMYFVVKVPGGFGSLIEQSATFELTKKNQTKLTLNINIKVVSPLTANLNNDNSIEFSCSPNPAKEVLNVNSAKTIDSVRLLDMTGKVVSNKNVNSKAATLDTSNLVSGIYILKTSIEGKVITKKIVKN